MPDRVQATAGLRTQRLRTAIEDVNSFGTALLAIVLDNYGTDPFAWEPMSLRYQLKDDFGANLHKLNEDKIWGLIVALTTNQFYVAWEIFAQTCKALNGDEADFSIYSPADPEDLAWGVTEVLLNDRPDKDSGNEQFSHEVARYTGLILAENGVWLPPGVLEFAEYDHPNPTLALESAFVDDADMFEAARQNQQLKKARLEEGVKEKLKQLFAQIDSLPLTNRTKFLTKREEPSRL